MIDASRSLLNTRPQTAKSEAEGKQPITAARSLKPSYTTSGCPHIDSRNR